MSETLREALEALPRYTNPDGDETWLEWAAVRDLLNVPLFDDEAEAYALAAARRDPDMDYERRDAMLDVVRRQDAAGRDPEPVASADAAHIHRYGLVPVWKADGSEVESWWWCTDHPRGEWVRIEDDEAAREAGAAIRGTEAGLDVDVVREALMILPPPPNMAAYAEQVTERLNAGLGVTRCSTTGIHTHTFGGPHVARLASADSEPS
jgi:hypothetical protein